MKYQGAITAHNMVKQLSVKPEGYFTKLPNHYMWFELYHKSEIYCYIGIEIIGMWASLHTHIIRWNHNTVKTLLKDWETLKHICRELGATQAVASNEDLKDKRWPKFIRMFGFAEPQAILISKQEL